MIATKYIYKVGYTLSTIVNKCKNDSEQNFFKKLTPIIMSLMEVDKELSKDLAELRAMAKTLKVTITAKPPMQEII